MMEQKKADDAKRHERRDLSASWLFWKSFKEIKGLVLFGISTLIGLVLKKSSDTTSVPLWIVVLVAVFLLLVLVALMNALMDAVSLAKEPRRITVLECTKPGGPYPDAHAVLVVRAPDGLPVDATVAVYRINGVVQEHIGIGTVQHQQDDETYQVTLDSSYPGVDISSLFDRNTTKITNLSARLEVSFSKAARSRRPVTKAQAESNTAMADAAGLLPAVSQNPAVSVAIQSSPEVEK